MAKDLSRREEQRGSRKLYLWVIPLALALGIVLVFGVFLTDYLFPPDRTGMDETAKTQGSANEESKQALTPATVQTQQSDTYGEYLADGFGRPLYLFKGDRRSSGDEPAVSTCYEDCANAWPPLISSGAAKTAGQAKADLLATIERRDRSKQVTYNGWLLYRYVKDFGPEKATGQDVKDFGAEWYLVTPSGEDVHVNAEGGKR
jgi:predicted lipoprotein with Yx(FWY)xxD motif